jgi:hypothetical protein
MLVMAAVAVLALLLVDVRDLLNRPRAESEHRRA